MLFNTVEELKACLSTVHKSQATSLLTFVATAEALHLAPSLGAGLVHQLGNLPALNPPAHLVALRDQLRPALAYYVVLEAAPLLAVSMNDLGVTEQQTAGAAPSRQWVYNNFIEAASSTADKLLDLALAWLDDNAADYVQELDSKEYRSRSRLLIANAAQLGMYLATAYSRRFFLALLPTLRQVEEFEINDLLGETLLEDLRDGLESGLPPSAATKKLLGLVRPVLAHRALAQGILSMSVALTGTTLRLLSDNEAVRQRLAADEKAISNLSQQATANADKWQAKLAAYLDAQRPTEPTVSAELYDNTGSKSFVV
jgi:hypothetical protein